MLRATAEMSVRDKKFRNRLTAEGGLPISAGPTATASLRMRLHLGYPSLTIEHLPPAERRVGKVLSFGLFLWNRLRIG
jgi:hypothetical protein